MRPGARELAAVVASAVFFSGAAGGAPGSLATACQLDFQLFCSEVDPESPREAVVACLERYKPSLTEPCRAAIDPSTVPRAPAGGAGIDGACQEDFARLCSDATDRMSAARCVRRNFDALSPACRDVMASRMRNRGGPPGGRPGASARP